MSREHPIGNSDMWEISVVFKTTQRTASSEHEITIATKQQGFAWGMFLIWCLHLAYYALS